MIKKIVASVFVLGVAGNSYAVCPPNINGKWSGVTVKSEDGRWTNTETGDSGTTHSTENDAHVIVVNGSVAQPLYFAQASSGIFGDASGGPAQPETLPVTFDRATCSGTFGSEKSGGVYYFVVSDGGKTIQAVGNEKNAGNFGNLKFESGTAKITTFYKQ